MKSAITNAALVVIAAAVTAVATLAVLDYTDRQAARAALEDAQQRLVYEAVAASL